MTVIYLSGAENPTHQEILLACGAQRLAVNVGSLLRRKTVSWTLEVPEGVEWVAFTDSDLLTEEDLEKVVAKATAPPLYVIGPSSWSSWSTHLPVWSGDAELPEERTNGFVVTDRVMADRLLRRKALAARTHGSPLGVITGSKHDLGRFDLVVSAAWWSTMKYGETQVWDGAQLCRYAADVKTEVRHRHQQHIEALGVDVGKVLADDPEEVAKLAIVSWSRYAEKLSLADVVTLRSSGENAEVSIDGMGLEVSSGTGAEALDTPPPPVRHRSLLPVLGVDEITTTVRGVDGAETVDRLPIQRSVASSFRKCDNCVLGTAGCPGFQPGASCAYEIPVELKSKDQLQHTMTSLLEMQTQRILEARFQEQVLGQELTGEVGREMDRFFQLVEKMRDIMDNREVMKVTMEARGNNGMISRLFGAKVGENSKMLTQPVSSDEIIEDAVVLDDSLK